MLSVGSLFSGIGGFDLGLERAGMRVLWQCEQDEFCRRVLAKHWPGVPCYSDICDLRGVDVEPVGVLAGGFPCQDISGAGNGAGLAGARSGLWSEFIRLIRELRPRYAVVENVPVLRTRGLAQILSDLTACGYDAEWDGIPASTVGAPHKRDRIWIVAYPNQEGWTHAQGREGSSEPDGWAVAEPGHALARSSHWLLEPNVDRVVDGLSPELDRMRVGALGNALVPQIAEWIGRRIIGYEEGRAAA